MLKQQALLLYEKLISLLCLNNNPNYSLVYIVNIAILIRNNAALIGRMAFNFHFLYFHVSVCLYRGILKKKEPMGFEPLILSDQSDAEQRTQIQSERASAFVLSELKQLNSHS